MPTQFFYTPRAASVQVTAAGYQTLPEAPPAGLMHGVIGSRQAQQ